MIYILEDDESIRKLVVYGLESQGFTVEGFALPSAFHRAMERALPELVLLDLMLPEEDGLHILRDLRASAATRTLPVILLTARDTEYDRVIGLDGGADDFITKPFSMLELAARIRAVLRRTGSAAPREYRAGPLRVCPAQRIVQVAQLGATRCFSASTIRVIRANASSVASAFAACRSPAARTWSVSSVLGSLTVERASPTRAPSSTSR